MASDDFEVVGADQFLALSKALKHAGRTELRKELNKAMRDGAKPLIPKARAEAFKRLPQRGGFARQVSKEPARVQTRTGRDPGVRVVVGKKRGGAQAANRGVIRHPVFGNRNVWVNQPVPPGWFDDTMQANAPEIRKALQQGIEDVAAKVIREVEGGTL